METESHIMVAIIIVAVLYPFFGVYSFLAILTSPLMDLDHIVNIRPFLRKHGKLTVKNIRIYLEEYQGPKTYHVFHTIEFFIILIILTVRYKFLIPVLVSYIVHIFMDISQDAYRKPGLLGPRYLSFVEVIWQKFK